MKKIYTEEELIRFINPHKTGTYRADLMGHELVVSIKKSGDKYITTMSFDGIATMQVEDDSLEAENQIEDIVDTEHPHDFNYVELEKSDYIEVFLRGACPKIVGMYNILKDTGIRFYEPDVNEYTGCIEIGIDLPEKKLSHYTKDELNKIIESICLSGFYCERDSKHITLISDGNRSYA